MRVEELFATIVKLEDPPKILKNDLLLDSSKLVHLKEGCGLIKENKESYIYFTKGDLLIVDKIECLLKTFERLEKKALYDGLTGCLYKEQMLILLEKFLKNYIRYRKDPFSLIAFDVDHFKRINDTYGHLAGDFVLKELTTLVKERLRQSDVCARMGGEEFLVLLPNTKSAGALRLAEQIRKRIEEHPFIYHNQQIPVTISLGVTSASLTDSVESLLSRVDEALYDAKHKGRNRVEYR